MQKYSDFERMNSMALQREENKKKESVSCPNCSSGWFEHVRIGRYVADHNVILGQEVPGLGGDMGYVMLKCVRCHELLEPRIIHNTRDIGGDAYDDLLDVLEGKGDIRKDNNKE